MAKRIIISVGAGYRYGETELDLAGLRRLQARLGGVSTSELIRRAVRAYLVQHGEAQSYSDDLTKFQLEMRARLETKAR